MSSWGQNSSSGNSSRNHSPGSSENGSLSSQSSATQNYAAYPPRGGRPTARPLNSSSSSGSQSSGGSTAATSEHSMSSPLDKIEEDISKPSIGQIYLPGQPIVSSQHRALDRYKEWEQANIRYLQGVDMRTRWEYYITNRDVRQLRPTPDGKSSEGSSGVSSYEALGLFVDEEPSNSQK